METKKTDLNSSLAQLENTLDLYLVQKAPNLPEGVKQFIVSVAPWVTLILMVLSLPLILAVIGLGTLFAPFGMMGGYNSGLLYILSMIVLAASIVFEIMAIPGLFKRSRKAWTFLFYAELLSIVSNLIGLNIVSGIVGGLIGLYFLFQVRSYYK